MLFFFIQLNEVNHYNDASLIIYKAFLHLLDCENPYSFIYELPWGTGTFTQPFNYGPMIFFIYLPAMLLPIWYHDLWIGMAVMINLYSFGIAEILSRIGSQDLSFQVNSTLSITDKDPHKNRLLYYGGLFFWMLPFGTTVISVFIYAPIFLCTLAFIYRKYPLIAGFFLMNAALSYQLVLLFVPIFGIYYLKQNWNATLKFVIGCIPALLTLCFFILWQFPAGTIDSLFLYTSRMPYIKCENCGNDLDKWSIFSIPHLLYVLSGGVTQIGNYFRLGVIIVLGIYCCILLFKKETNNQLAITIIKYQILTTILFTLSTNYGQVHYLFFLFVPLLYLFQYFKPDFQKNRLIKEREVKTIKKWKIFQIGNENFSIFTILMIIVLGIFLFFGLFMIYLLKPDIFYEGKLDGLLNHLWLKWGSFSIGVVCILCGFFVYKQEKTVS
ncbi:MAG: hypothetical protein K9W44_09300 [Candidatus Lokiarchaeota archaeon]|nr:hypothetical protein [Candidatus Harpocratesius repetitus]